MNQEKELINLITRSLSYLYATDPSSPSLIISYLNNESCLYASVVRYNKKFGKDKVVSFSTKGNDLKKILFDVSLWVMKQKRYNPLNDLECLILDLQRNRFF